MFIQLYSLWIRARSKLFTLSCRNNFYRIGRGTVLLPPIRLGGVQFIEIGDNVFIGANSWIQVLQSPPQRSRPVITIGDNTSIVGSCTLTAAQSVVIEKRVLMAGNVYISDHTHEHRSREIAIKDQGVTGVAPVRICEGAWLGQNVVVCPGVTIGRNAVVGANSVVRADIPDFCVAAGAPARVIRKIDHPRDSEMAMSLDPSSR